jgi:hypothetical protein
VYRFNVNPLVWWVWFGGLVLVLGGLVTMWPGGGPAITTMRRPQTASQQQPVLAGSVEP